MSDVEGLQERAKELRCLYRVQDALADRSQNPATVFMRVLEAIPDGWREPDHTGACIDYLGRSYVGPGYSRDGSAMSAPIRLGNSEVGSIQVVHSGVAIQADPLNPSSTSGAGVFLREERQLLSVIARRLGEYLEWKHTQLLGAGLPNVDEHWRWRENYAEALAAQLDRARFGVSRVLLGGSTERGTAGPGSDIDLFVEFEGNDEQRRELSAWIEGWSLCLAELGYRKTGYRVTGGLIELHFLDASTDPRSIHEYRMLPCRD
jgi:hypothetical protein